MKVGEFNGRRNIVAAACSCTAEGMASGFHRISQHLLMAVTSIQCVERGVHAPIRYLEVVYFPRLSVGIPLADILK